jgi:hypothetical protein
MLRFRGDQGTDDILYTGIELHHLRGDNVSSLNQSYTTSTAMSLGYGSPTNVIVDNMDIHDIGYNQPPGSSCNACYVYGTYIGKGFTI